MFLFVNRTPQTTYHHGFERCSGTAWKGYICFVGTGQGQNEIISAPIKMKPTGISPRYPL